MPSAEELEQLLESAEDHLDAYEISRLEQMRAAAVERDKADAESPYAIEGDEDGD